MPILTIDIPQQTFESLAMEPSALAGTMKVMTALKMYELGQLSSRQVATLASVSHGAFLQLLRTYQVPPFLLTYSPSLRNEGATVLTAAYQRTRLCAANEIQLPEATFPDVCP